MNYSFKPIVKWPGEHTKTRRKSPFKSGYVQAIRLLERELGHISAQAVFIQLAVREDDIRNDGLPRSGARPTHPGVIVSFTRAGAPYSFPCDTFWDWQQNLRAIALSLDALRRIDRYGVTKLGQQYAGFKQLPGPLVTPAAMTVEQAAEFVSGLQNADGPTRQVILTNHLAWADAYRVAVKRLHPDAGGNPADWSKLQRAAEEMLRLHHDI